MKRTMLSLLTAALVMGCGTETKDNGQALPEQGMCADEIDVNADAATEGATFEVSLSVASDVVALQRLRSRLNQYEEVWPFLCDWMVVFCDNDVCYVKRHCPWSPVEL